MHAGVSKAALQRMQSQLSKTAGMVAQMAGSAGWWQLEILCGSLSEVAAAGARPELLPLMQVQIVFHLLLWWRAGLTCSNMMVAEGWLMIRYLIASALCVHIAVAAP
jgi:hypothetical protein